ncbi:MAG TPA: lysophospholipase [Kofleriaceae bacterium]|nr:lysophospholipase [Kofleriaceae bacterium]
MTPPGPLEPNETRTVASSGDTTLYVELFRPAAAPRAVAVVVHGYAEHIGRYREVAHVLVNAGLAVVGFDLRGHGRSSGRRGVIRSFTDYLDDLDAALAVARELHPGLPVVLVAHSNGGLITLRALTDERRRPAVAGAVISSPFLALKLAVPKARIWVARAASRLFPGFTQKNGLRVEDITSDKAMQQARLADTLCHEVASARWFTESMDAQAHVRARATSIDVPTLWLIGGADPIADPAVSNALARTVPKAEVHLLEGFLHEVFNEVDRARPFALMTAALDRFVPAAAAAS